MEKDTNNIDMDLAEYVLNDLVDDISFDYILRFHKAYKTKKIHKNLDKNVFNIDIKNNFVKDYMDCSRLNLNGPTVSLEQCETNLNNGTNVSLDVRCPVCNETVSGVRFAPHLEKCMNGSGRRQSTINSSVNVAAALAVNSSNNVKQAKILVSNPSPNPKAPIITHNRNPLSISSDVEYKAMEIKSNTSSNTDCSSCAGGASNVRNNYAYSQEDDSNQVSLLSMVNPARKRSHTSVSMPTKLTGTLITTNMINKILDSSTNGILLSIESIMKQRLMREEKGPESETDMKLTSVNLSKSKINSGIREGKSRRLDTNADGSNPLSDGIHGDLSVGGKIDSSSVHSADSISGSEIDAESTVDSGSGLTPSDMPATAIVRVRLRKGVPLLKQTRQTYTEEYFNHHKHATNEYLLAKQANLEKKERIARLKTERRDEMEERIAAKAARLEMRSNANLNGRVGITMLDNSVPANHSGGANISNSQVIPVYAGRIDDLKDTGRETAAGPMSGPNQHHHMDIQNRGNINLNAAQVQYLREKVLMEQGAHQRYAQSYPSVSRAPQNVQTSIEQRNAQMQHRYQSLVPQQYVGSKPVEGKTHVRMQTISQTHAQQLAQHQMLAQQQLLQATNRIQRTGNQQPSCQYPGRGLIVQAQSGAPQMLVRQQRQGQELLQQQFQADGVSSSGVPFNLNRRTPSLDSITPSTSHNQGQLTPQHWVLDYRKQLPQQMYPMQQIANGSDSGHSFDPNPKPMTPQLMQLLQQRPAVPHYHLNHAGDVVGSPSNSKSGNSNGVVVQGGHTNGSVLSVPGRFLHGHAEEVDGALTSSHASVPHEDGKSRSIHAVAETGHMTNSGHVQNSLPNPNPNISGSTAYNSIVLPPPPKLYLS